MSATSQPNSAHAAIDRTLHATFARLIDRTTEKVGNTTSGQALRWLLALAALYLGWRLVRSFRTVFWTIFGLGMALWWMSPWRFTF